MRIHTLASRLAIWAAAIGMFILATAALSAARAADDMNVSQFTDLPDPVPAGGFVTYDLRVENSGADPTPSNALLKVRLPAGTVFQSVAPGAECSYASGPHEVDCNFGILPGTLVDPSAFRLVQIVVQATTPGVINAQAQVWPNDGNPANNTLAVNTTVDNGADVRFRSFVATPNPVTAAGIVTYTIVTENLGPNAAGALSIRFNVPPGLTYQSFSNAGGWSCGLDAGQVLCTNSAGIAAGTPASPATGPTLAWSAKVTANVVGTLTTSGTVSSATGDGNLSNNTSTADVNVQAGTDLGVVKTVSADPMIAGSAISFGLAVTNHGPFPASTVEVVDTLPPGFTGITASGSGWTCGVAVSTVTCTRATFAVGSAPITINATAPVNGLVPPGGTNVTNSARVSSATADPISSNDTSAVTFRLLQDGADLRPTLSRGPTPVPLDSDITSTLRVRNDGPRAANGTLRITYQLAPGEALHSFTGSSWSCLPSAPPATTAGVLVTCERTAYAGGLGVGSTSNPITLVTRTTQAGTVLGTVCTSATAGLAPTEGDIDTTNDCITNDGSVVASSTTADLALVKEVTAPVPPAALATGDSRISYRLTVTNNGPDAATNVTLTDPIPMYSAAANGRPATTVTASVAGGTGGTCSGTSTVTCNLGTVLVGTPKVVTVHVDRPMRDGNWRNTASAFSSSIGDPNRSNNTSFADVTVAPVTDIELTSKTVTPSPVKSGVEATYVITIRNNGPSPAQSVRVTDTFAATGANGTYTFISATATDGGTCTPGSPSSGISAAFPVECNFGTVEPNGVRSMTVKIRPDYMTTPPSPRQIQNTATVTTTTVESNSTNNSANATLSVVSDEIDLLITETDLVDPVGFSPPTPASNVMVYKVDVTNRGPSYATNVRFTDVTTPPAGKTLTFMCDRDTPPPTPHNTGTACPSPSPICTGSFPTITCTIGDMAATATYTRYLVYRVNDAPATTGDTYNKTATVTANEAETLSANNQDPEQTTVRMLADLEVVSKAASLTPVTLNQHFTWTIVGRNNGPGTGVNTRFTDNLPSGMELTGTPTWTTSASTSGTCTGTTGGTSLTCNVGDMASAATATITVPVRVTSYPSGGTSTNRATVVTDSIDPTGGNNFRDGTVAVTRSSIACSVYHDVNDDGVRQAGEAGIRDVVVQLTGRDLYNNPVTRTATTNSSGDCLFNNLPPSDASGYTITETQPTGWQDGRDNRAGTVIAASKGTDVIAGIVLPADTSLTGYTFGELQLASIAGRVWHDVDNNGIIAGTETQRIQGVTITLDGTDDLGAAVTRSAITGTNGDYSFTGLRPGTYRLVQTQPAAPWLEGRAAVGTGITGTPGTPDNALAAPTFGNVIANIQIQSGNAGVEYNFGELRPASVAGIVWYDADNNGQRNGLEPIIDGVTVTLAGTDYRGNAVTARVATTAAGTGAYAFTGLVPGTYTLTETQPAAYADGQTRLGTLGGSAVGTAGVNVFTGVVLPSDGAGTGYDFGERGRGIGGSVYVDANDDGIRQGGEVGIPGATVRLSGCGENRSALTDGQGYYTFIGLADCPGGYTLDESQPAGFSDGRDTAGTVGGTVSNDRITGIVLGATTFASGYNFGEFGIVATDVRCTTPAPATRNVREPFNWTFDVAIASGGAAPATRLQSTLPAGLELTGQPTLSNGGTCTGAATQTSYACTIGYVVPGQTVTVTAPVRALAYPSGGTLTSSATVSTEGNDTTNNTCQSTVTIRQATLAGTVFEDPNNDGVKQSGDRGIGGVTVTLTGKDLYGNDVNVPVQTLPDGTYLFGGLAPSDAAGYTVAETQPSGYADGRDTAGSKGGTVTNDRIAGVPLLAGENATGYDFAEIGQGIAGTVYVDSNDNGVRDPGERGIANVTIRVTGTSSTGGNIDVTRTTDGDGNYLFGDLPPSSPAGYTIVETQPTAWADGRDRAGTLGGTVANDRITAVVLPGGTVGTGYDFGEKGGRLCGYVYVDRNDNGIKDRAEAGIPGATVTLTGTDIDGNPLTVVATTATLSTPGADLGRYCVGDLPLPGPGGYTLTETQPADTTDGRDAVGTLGGTLGNDVIGSVSPTQAGFTGEGYNFGERITNGAALSGYVWLDVFHDRLRDPTGRGGWTVELVSGVPGSPSTVIATTVTDANGFYRFDGLPPGPGYTVLFRSPQGGYVYGFIANVTLTANTELTEQNQPVDPSGVVYDALTRQPVPGAIVRIDGPAGFDPAIHLVGGAANVNQTTDATGEYKYLLIPGAPSGTYRLSVTVPTGYVQRVSTAIPPCTATLTVGPAPNPALVQSSDRAPAAAIPLHNPASCAANSAGLAAGAGTTQYYLSLVISGTSANLINNHIPVERLPTTDALVVTKTTPKGEVSRGELVPYTITVRNNIDLRQTDIRIEDQIPPGFQYRAGSATIDGLAREPARNGRLLAWGPLTIERNQTVTVRLLLVVGSGVGAGEFVNQAWASNAFTGNVVSNVAKATVRVVPDATFDCSEVIGKVFDDRNRNGVQDDGEPGIANVRVVSVRGQQITTDSHGRFHVACADIPDEDRGTNYVLKLDERTLPTGYRLTTENPGLVRLTRGKMAKLNFGASIQRVVRLDLKDQAFVPGTTTLRPEYQAGFAQLLPVLRQEQSVLRVAYGRGVGEDAKAAQARVREVAQAVRAAWRQASGGYALAIETEVYQAGGGK